MVSLHYIPIEKLFGRNTVGGKGTVNVAVSFFLFFFGPYSDRWSLHKLHTQQNIQTASPDPPQKTGKEINMPDDRTVSDFIASSQKYTSSTTLTCRWKKHV